MYVKGVDFSVDEHAPASAVYVIDFSFMNKYAVREGYEPYGTKVYFNQDRAVVAFHWTTTDKWYVAGDASLVDDPWEYEHVKAVFRSTLFVVVTIYHLVVVHWIVSNGMVLGTTRRLSSRHPLRRMLKPHVYGTANINRHATAAIGPYEGLVGRAMAFTEDSWLAVVADTVSHFRYESFPETFINAGLPQECLETMPMYQDGMDLWNVMYQYVERFTDALYPSDEDVLQDAELLAYWREVDASLVRHGRSYGLPVVCTKDALVHHLTHGLFWVTGGHSLVGHLQEYIASPCGCPCKIRHMDNAATIQTHLQGLLLSCLTNLHMPFLLNEWLHLYRLYHDTPLHDVLVQIVDMWQTDLITLSHTIHERNNNKTLRPYHFGLFDPSDLISSVAM